MYIPVGVFPPPGFGEGPIRAREPLREMTSQSAEDWGPNSQVRVCLGGRRHMHPVRSLSSLLSHDFSMIHSLDLRTLWGEETWGGVRLGAGKVKYLSRGLGWLDR